MILKSNYALMSPKWIYQPPQSCQLQTHQPKVYSNISTWMSNKVLITKIFQFSSARLFLISINDTNILLSYPSKTFICLYLAHQQVLSTLLQNITWPSLITSTVTSAIHCHRFLHRNCFRLSVGVFFILLSIGSYSHSNQSDPSLPCVKLSKGFPYHSE